MVFDRGGEQGFGNDVMLYHDTKPDRLNTGMAQRLHIPHPHLVISVLDVFEMGTQPEFAPVAFEQRQIIGVAHVLKGKVRGTRQQNLTGF